MWARISHLILRHRMPILIGMLLITAFMGWQAMRLELSYKYARVLPADDPAGIAYEEFKARYGEDGNVMVVAFQDSNLFRLDRVQGWYDLTESVRKVAGIQDVMSITRCYNLLRNDSLEKFDVTPLISSRPATQADADSLQKKIVSLPFYEGLILNKKTKTTVMVVTFKQSDLNSKSRIDIVQQVKEMAQAFGAKTNIQMRYSGMPYIRTEYMRKISSEMKLFSILSLVVTALILILFFRYFNAVFYSLIVVIVGVIWSLGIMVLFGYKITVLSGLIPPLIVIIGLPNCIFLINKYQEELLKHGNKAKALGRMVQKVGLSNFLANVTTAIGFFVFYFTQSSLLVEFGIVAAISVMTTYAIAMILTPIFFSWLPEPKLKHAKHLNNS
ncbi:MAG: efflux RND transporter permease subunit, partial [Bacteroidia bacterium]